jgi:hypothetical protein
MRAPRFVRRRRLARATARRIQRVAALVGQAADPGPVPCLGSERPAGNRGSARCPVCGGTVPVVPDGAGWGGAVLAVHPVAEADRRELGPDGPAVTP